MKTYTIDKYDPPENWNEDGWVEVISGVTARECVEAVRDLESQGYDRDCSVYVSRDDYWEELMRKNPSVFKRAEAWAIR